ncbi:MAG: hypothetical protein DWQ36_18690 [Acidobacteria bacterium]|nr:MAG: hypothetical protein DWQ30_03750 [Acidobacteriota bacterium]REK03802.1 MAG: hypothetical protein DWQ36_18690 [Acidobacteriota bacterium]
MRIRALVQGILLLASTAAHVAEAQTLYGLEFNGGAGGGAFVELDRIAGSDVSLIGNAAALTAARGMAMDPTTGVLYALQSVGGASSTDLYTLDPSIGAATFVATIFDTGGTANPPVRDLTFDGAGQLWGVTGQAGVFATSVLAIDKASGVAQAPLASTAGDREQTIAYRGADRELWVYSADGLGNHFLERVDRNSGAKTNVPLAGAGPSSRVLGLVHDPIDDVFRFFTLGAAYWTLSPAGVQTDTGNTGARPYIGLAFDRVTTAEEVFVDGFESGDVSSWSSSTP